MEDSYRSKVTEAGRVVIPVDLRNAFEIREGEEVLFTWDSGGIRIVPLKRAIQQAQNLFASLAPESVVMSEELIRERRADGTSDE